MTDFLELQCPICATQGEATASKTAENERPHRGR
jgi:hypothetical protein